MHVERKASAKSALHTVLEAITSLPHLALYNGLACLAECIEKEHGATLVMHKTTTGTLQWCQEMSSGRRLGYLASMWSQFLSVPFAAQLGFVHSPQQPAILSLSRHTMNDLANSMFEVLCLFMGKDILYLESWRSCPPGMFAALVSTNPHESSAARAHCKALYEALLVAEKASLSKPSVCAFLDALLWPRAVWVREIFVALSECRWEHTPNDLTSELRSSFMRHGTKTVEDMIGFVRRQLRANQMGQLGPLRQWHRLIDCGILKEEDQKPIHATAGDKQSSNPDLSEAWLHAMHQDFSLGEGSLTELMAGSGWPHPGPVAFAEVPLATAALVAFCNEPSHLQQLLFSKLAMPGWLVYKKGNDFKTGGLALYSCAVGMVLHKVCVNDVGGERFFSPSAPTQTDSELSVPWEMQHIIDHAGWVTRQVKVTLPCTDPDLEPRDMQHPQCMALAFEGDETPVLEACAASAFARWTVAELQWLIKTLGFHSGTPPVLVRECVECAVKGALPWLSEDELSNILDLRTFRKKATVESVVTTSNIDTLLGAVEQDDYVQLTQVLKGSTKAKEASTASSSRRPSRPAAKAADTHMQEAAAASSSAPASVPAARQTQTEKLPRPALGAKYTLEEGKALMPQTMGVSLSIHSGKAWQAKYTNRISIGPRSRMHSWGAVTGLTFNQALRDTLKWAWDMHLEAVPGSMCPHDLDSLAD